jgi:hypothetical protein
MRECVGNILVARVSARASTTGRGRLQAVEVCIILRCNFEQAPARKGSRVARELCIKTVPCHRRPATHTVDAQRDDLSELR